MFLEPSFCFGRYQTLDSDGEKGDDKKAGVDVCNKVGVGVGTICEYRLQDISIARSMKALD